MGTRQERKQSARQQKRELRWLLDKSKRHAGSILLISLLGLLATGLGLGSSVVSKYLVDGIAGRQGRLALWAGCVLAGLVLANLLLKAVSSRVSTRIRVRIRNAGQRQAYEKILQAGWEALEPYRSGDLLQRLNGDIGVVSEGIIGLVPGMISVALRFAGAFVIMLCFDPMLAVLAVLAMPATFVFSRLLTRPLRRHDQRLKELNSQIMSFQEDSFRNLTSIKAFAITDRFLADMDGLQDAYARQSLAMNRIQVRITTVTAVLSSLFVGACFGWSAWRLWEGQMTFGSLTMFMQLMNELRVAFSGLLGLLQRTVTLTTSAGRIMAVEALEQENTREPAGLRQEEALTVSLKNTAFSYSSGDVVLHPFDFTALPGDTVAVTGPSGEGKTTLLRLLLGLVAPVSGSAELVGRGRYSLCAGTRGMFAYVPQGNSIFAGTVAENLRLVRPEATDVELEQALEAACALEFVRQLPGGLEHRLGAGGRGISEGQAQRLAVARALLKQAPILLLDEATSAMDMQTEARLLHNLRASGLVRTCILVTHRPGSAAFCNRTYEIRDGTVTEVRHEA